MPMPFADFNFSFRIYTGIRYFPFLNHKAIGPGNSPEPTS